MLDAPNHRPRHGRPRGRAVAAVAHRAPVRLSAFAPPFSAGAVVTAVRDAGAMLVQFVRVLIAYNRSRNEIDALTEADLRDIRMTHADLVQLAWTDACRQAFGRRPVRRP